MSLTTKQAQSRIPTRQQPTPRLWKVPASKAWWLWLAVSLLLYGSIFVVYEQAIRTQQYPGPFYARAARQGAELALDAHLARHCRHPDRSAALQLHPYPQQLLPEPRLLQ